MARPLAMLVALLGGESSGKSTLSLELTAALQAHGLRVALVPEHLRAWCMAAGRAPLAHEQADIAAEQDRQIATALQGGADVVVADTTGLVVAAYSAHYFADDTLWPDALQRHRRADLTLLMGLDLPWQPDGLFRDSPAVRDAMLPYWGEVFGNPSSIHHVGRRARALLDSSMLAATWLCRVPRTWLTCASSPRARAMTGQTARSCAVMVCRSRFPQVMEACFACCRRSASIIFRAR